MTFLGWTRDQWARAAARYPTGDHSLNGALALKRQWQMSCVGDPGDVTILGSDGRVIAEYDYEYADSMVNWMAEAS